MNLLETISQYYQGEARHGLWGAIIGGLLLAGSVILWKWAAPLSLLKGLSVPMLLFGLLVGIGGAGDNYLTNNAAPGKIAFYQQDHASFLRQEKAKVEKTHQGWPALRIGWAVLGFGGLLLSLFIRKPFWVGAGLGTIGLAIMISVFEFYSMKFNERYYKAITSAIATPAVTKAVPTSQPLETVVVHEQPIKVKEKQLNPQPDTVVLESNPRERVNLQTASCTTAQSADTASLGLKLEQPVIAAVVLPLNANLSSPEWAKKKKRLDYYHSDLIGAGGVNARHCWFGKKYIKE